MKRIILLYPAMIPSVRLCGYEQFTLLAKQGKISFDAFPVSEVTSRALKTADAVVFVRGDSDFEVRLAKKLRAAGKYLIYVLDDDLLNIPDYLDSSTYYSTPFVQNAILSLMGLCDCFMTPSEKLAEKYGGSFSRTVMIEEPALCCLKREPHDGPVKIGFAGSVDRTLDFEQILGKPIRSIKQRFGDRVEIEFFGIEPQIARDLNCVCHPYADNYAAYQDTMRSLDWDIGLAPMPDTAFHACKHYNKFIEYGSFGIISVCSKLPPYTRIIRHGENGMLCPNEPDSWEKTLAELVAGKALREKLADGLYQQIRDSFQLPTTSEVLWQELDGCFNRLRQHKMGSLFTCRIASQLHTLLPRIRRHGWKLPFVVVKKLFSRLIRKKNKEESSFEI